MSQDYYNRFYNRFKVLQEEYEKKQLYLLKLEREQLTKINVERTNLNLHENLQRINKRMENTGETYRKIMKKMEEMDHSTDLLLDTLKEKLALYNASKETYFSTLNFRNQELPETSNQELFKSSNQELHKVKSSFNMQTEKLTTLAQPVQQNLNTVSTQTSVSTQTEIIYCENCSSEIFHTALKNLNVAESSQASNLQFASSHLSMRPLPSESRVSLPNFLPETKISTQVTSSMASLHCSTEVDANKSFQTRNSEIIQQPDSKKQDSELHVMGDENLIPNSNSFENLLNLNQNEILTTENELGNTAKDKEFPNLNSEISLTERTEKSDEESMNHEFDFLETVTTNAGVRDKSKETNKFSLEKDSNLKSNPSPEQENQTNLKQKEASKSVVLENPAADIISDNKSDVSLSIIEPGSPHPHSSNVSALSDSESLSGKETPLKASAAYQALLGGTSIVEKKREQIDSDSDSLNEVENVLANAVRKKSVVLPKSSIQQNKEEKSIPLQGEINSTKKVPKQTSGSKSQSKLSKKTRKVLGLDTSSGSEVELAVKPPEKDGEDSDEFDFYD